MLFVRFVSDNDKDWFNTELLRLIDSNLGQESLAVAKETKMFVDFMRDAPEPTGEEEGDGETELPKIYEPVESIKTLTERLHFFLEQYNDIMRGSSMDLVFFEDAIGHLVKIARALRNPGGNIMLVRSVLLGYFCTIFTVSLKVGVGGSGKQSLTKLASFICSYKPFQISVTRSYNLTNFIEDLKVGKTISFFGDIYNLSLKRFSSGTVG